MTTDSTTRRSTGLWAPTRLLAATVLLAACGESDPGPAGAEVGGGGPVASASTGGGGAGGSVDRSSSTGTAGEAGSGAGGEAAGTGGAGTGGAPVTCTKKVHLHMGNFSWVASLAEAAGLEKNDCWTYEARGAGFRCNYDGAQADHVATSGNGTYASYNEIKPLNQHDADAVSHCKQQSGGKPVRTYIAWNGVGWDNEGIGASVHFAEVYGTQADRESKFTNWKNRSASYKATYRPMINLSPETASSVDETYASVRRICDASKSDQWLGIYFYDPSNANGSGMADWKRKEIIRAMNDCTTK